MLKRLDRPYKNNKMNPLLIVLDDWEGHIQASACWDQTKELVEIKFLKQPLDGLDRVSPTGDAR